MWIKLLLQFDVATDIYLEVNNGQVTSRLLERDSDLSPAF